MFYWGHLDVTPVTDAASHAAPATYHRPRSMDMGGTAMPLWKIHHPVDAYTPADKKEFAGAITAV